MRPPSSLVLALVGLLLFTLFGGAPATGSPRQRDEERLEQLERWVSEFARNGPETSPENIKHLRELTSGLRMEALARPRRRNVITLGLLDLAAIQTSGQQRTARRTGQPAPPDPQTLRIRAYGERELEVLLAADGEHELATWLASGVLVLTTQPEARRLATLKLLRDEHLDCTQLALFFCTRDASRPVRESALRALVGWNEEGVHTVMFNQLERLNRDPDWIRRSTIRAHFDAVALDSSSESSKQLHALTRSGMVSADWRRAFRALELISAVPDEQAVPSLIVGLELWITRRESGGGSRRIENEIARELERRSGKRIGVHPERWWQWWKVTRGAPDDGGPIKLEERSVASFFGLRPVTDRVVFVIDRSLSMQGAFGTEGETRYSEAISQMVRFMGELGPQARFRVIVFGTDYDVWKGRLQPATEGNLRSASRWLRYHGPAGGTLLEPAIREVLRLDKRGRPDLGLLEADTVIVLCDGETSEGPGWVPALLAGPNEEAALAFHAVQIGGSDDGTLEALARGSGGDFVRVTP